jgi:hypothetical protein
VGSQYCLDFFKVFPTDLGGCELNAKLPKIFQALFAIDEIGIRNGIGGARKEVRQAHLVAHACGQHIEGKIKRAGDMLEDAVKQVMRDVRGVSGPQAGFPAWIEGANITCW